MLANPFGSEPNDGFVRLPNSLGTGLKGRVRRTFLEFLVLPVGANQLLDPVGISDIRAGLRVEIGAILDVQDQPETVTGATSS